MRLNQFDTKGTAIWCSFSRISKQNKYVFFIAFKNSLARNNLLGRLCFKYKNKPHKDTKPKKKKKKENNKCAQDVGNWNPHPLLVGMYNGVQSL